MDYSKKTISELRRQLDNKEVTSEDLFKEAKALAIKYQEKYNSFVTIMDQKEERESNSILSGIPYALKDNFSTKDILTTA